MQKFHLDDNKNRIKTGLAKPAPPGAAHRGGVTPGPPSIYVPSSPCSPANVRERIGESTYHHPHWLSLSAILGSY